MIVYALFVGHSEQVVAIARTVEELLPAIKQRLDWPRWTPCHGPVSVTVHIGEMDDDDFARCPVRVPAAALALETAPEADAPELVQRPLAELIGQLRARDVQTPGA
jgi:hypothetical protein